jgi:hypothetical protein
MKKDAGLVNCVFLFTLCSVPVRVRNKIRRSDASIAYVMPPRIGTV